MSFFVFFLFCLTSVAHCLVCTNGFIWFSPYGGYNQGHVASMPCLSGRCASFMTTATTRWFEQNVTLTTVFCAPEWLLNGTSNGCTNLTASDPAELCVCDTDNCNSGGMDSQPADTSDPPILCYEGLVSDARLVGRTGSHLIPCFGECYSISVNTTLSFGVFDATLYTCMPKNLFEKNLTFPWTNMSLPVNYCARLHEVEVCNCSFDACLDPGEKGAYPEPIVDLECIRGSFVYNTYEIGAEVLSYQVRQPCKNGMCANVITNCDSHLGGPGYLGQTMVERFCAPHEMVEEITGRRTGGCAFIDKNFNSSSGAWAAFACFCDNTADCNDVWEDLPPPPSPPAPTTSCFSGIGFNDMVIAEGFVPCAGVCSSTTFQQDAAVPPQVTVYGCSTKELCSIWDVRINRCENVYNMIDACHAEPQWMPEGLDEIGGLPEMLSRRRECDGSFILVKQKRLELGYSRVDLPKHQARLVADIGGQRF